MPVFKSKLAIAILGAVLVAGGGSAAALAASGHSPFDSSVRSAQNNNGQHNDGQHSDGQDDNVQNDSHQAEGKISSIDAGNSSFVVASEHSGDVTVVVDGKTAFDNGLSGFADLKVGMFVEVSGNFVTDTRLTATKIERGNDGNDTATGASGATGSDDPVGDDHGGGSGSSGGSGRGGHDDGVSHH